MTTHREGIELSLGYAQTLAALANGIRLGVHVWRVEDWDDPGALRLYFANRASEEATGRRPDDVIGLSLKAAFPLLLETEIPSALVEVARSGTGRELGSIDNRGGWVSEGAFAPRAFAIGTDQVAVAFNDVTALRVSERQRLETLERVGVGVITLDRQWRFRYVNEYAETLLGSSEAALTGHNFWDEELIADDADSATAIRQAMDERVESEFDWHLEARGLWMRVRAYPGPADLTLFCRDTTTERNLETQLRQAQKMEAIGQLTGSIAHDFNNLLTVISGYAELLRAKVDDETLRKPIGEILFAARHAAELTGQLLAYGRRQVLRPEPLDLNRTIDEYAGILRRLLGELVEVEAHLGEDVGTVYVDPGQLGQVIVNLAVNARDAMKDGGRLIIETSSVSLAEVDTDKHFDLAAGRYALFSITDSGSGIGPAVVDKIFDPFFTTKPVGEGTGLGLSTVLGIVKQSGGAVSVYSEPGVGTTIKIYLPEHDAPAAPPVDSGQGDDTARGERILVVDDAGSVRDYVAAVLSDTGYDVTTAATPGEALKLAAEHDFDLVISDVVMPESSGPELIASIQQERPGMRAVLMSGYAGEALGEIGAEFPYLQKPFTMADLRATIRAALD